MFPKENGKGDGFYPEFAQVAEGSYNLTMFFSACSDRIEPRTTRRFTKGRPKGSKKAIRKEPHAF